VPTQHVVTQGECFVSIARKYGVAWKTLYDHPANADLKSRRKNPNVLLEGDVVEIPDRPEKNVTVPTEDKHRFVVDLPRAKVRVHVKDADGQAHEGKRYVLRVGDLEEEGTVPADGLIEHDVPVDATEGTITIFFDPPAEDEAGEGEDQPGPPAPTFHQIALRIGHLDPIDCDAGAQARLENLGFHDVLSFQRKHGLEETGELDDATKQKLEELHLC
jgi:hypothetical protein